MMRDVTLGQYFPGKSPLHRMDPRVKTVMLAATLVIIFCTFNFVSLALAAGFVIAAVLMSGVPFSAYFKSLKMIIFVIIFTSILNLFYGTGNTIFQLGFLRITDDGIKNCIYVIVRIISLILASSILTFTTLPTDLTDALERLMKPLTFFHVRVHEIAMMMTIALRFIPTLLEETDKIMLAQKSRGADMESGGLLDRIKSLIPVLVPLFVSAFRRAYELATAMECRCYRGGAGRTRMKSLHLTRLDYIATAIMCCLLVGVILCNSFLGFLA